MSSGEFNPETIPMENVSVARKIFEEHGDFIRRVIRFHVGNKPEADDLFQDIFLFLILKPLPRDIRNVRSLLYRVITARVIDRFRHENRTRALINKYAQRKKEAHEEPYEDVLVGSESTEKMFSLISKHLPPNEALVVTLRYKYGFDVSQTAKRMGVKPRSVSHYLSTAINKIRYVFKDRYEEIL